MWYVEILKKHRSADFFDSINYQSKKLTKPLFHPL